MFAWCLNLLDPSNQCRGLLATTIVSILNVEKIYDRNT